MSAEWYSAAALNVSEIVRVPSPFCFLYVLMMPRNAHSSGSADQLTALSEVIDLLPDPGAAAAGASVAARSPMAISKVSGRRLWIMGSCPASCRMRCIDDVQPKRAERSVVPGAQCHARRSLRTSHIGHGAAGKNG